MSDAYGGLLKGQPEALLAFPKFGAALLHFTKSVRFQAYARKIPPSDPAT